MTADLSALLFGARKGSTKRSPEQQVALAVQILKQRHGDAVLAKMKDILGSRWNVVGPMDLTRNPLASYCDRFGRAYAGPTPLCSGVTPALAAVMGDTSATVTVKRYATANGHPMPTPMIASSEEALRYRLGVGYGATLLGWGPRSEQVYLDNVDSDDLTMAFADDDPGEPTVIEQRGAREIDGKLREVREVYDLTDREAPSYRIMLNGQDVTAAALGRTLSGDAYPWRYPDGKPYHRIVVTGRPRDVYRRAQLVEASLLVPVRWTAWGSGTDNASHPQRNVVGMALVGADSDSASGETGIATGAETVLQWVHIDPEKPGSHWQDAPAFDPEVLARAIRTYELAITSALDLPLSWEGTGGEPSAREAEALAERVSATFAECRRFDGQVLRRAAALATAMTGQKFPTTGYGTLYREEVIAALAAVEAPDDEEPDDEDKAKAKGKGAAEAA